MAYDALFKWFEPAVRHDRKGQGDSIAARASGGLNVEIHCRF